METDLRIVVLGCAGQVGREFFGSAGHLGQVIGIDRSRCDLSMEGSVWGLIRDLAPNVIVNCAAYTKVDKAEIDPSTHVFS